MRYGESDCDLCVKRPQAEGGKGDCPFRGAMLSILRERKDCLQFIEGSHIPKKKLHTEQEGLF